MPFDSTNFNIGHERLRQLSAALRQEQLPLLWDFGIDYRDTGAAGVFARMKTLGRCNSMGCALGLSKLMFPELKGKRPTEEFFDMPPHVFSDIFYIYGYTVPVQCVTPQMVADAIDKYLASVCTPAISG